MKYQIPYEGVEIEYTLYRKKVKYINLRINKMGNVIVSAPYKVPLETIHDFVKSKAPWIILHIARIEKIRHTTPWVDFRDGKTLYILGVPYRLTLLNGSKSYVLPDFENNICIYTTAVQDTADIYQTYLHWLKQLAIVKYEEIMDRVYPLVSSYSIARPKIQVRNMKTLWGSCTTNGNSIRLNLQLIKATESCIEQVMLHELIHFKYPNHGKEFYQMLSELMPDYKQRQQELETNYKDGI